MRARLLILAAVLGLLSQPGCGGDPPATDVTRPAETSTSPAGLSCDSLDAATRSFDLIPGPPQERPLAGGEAHAYRFTLAGDDFLDLVVDQQGIDLIAVLFDPAGAQLLAVDGLSGSVGPERVVWRSEEAGDYRLLACAGDVNQEPGSYRIAIREQRPAGAVDRDPVRAAGAFFAAQNLARDGGPEASAQAAARYREALALWQQLGDRRGQLEALYYLGVLHDQKLGERRQALKLYRQALPLFDQVADARLQANFLQRIGDAHYALDETEQALEPYRRALALWPLAGDVEGAAWTYNNLGFAHRFLGDLPAALEAYSEALTRWRELGEVVDEATTLHNRGRSYFYLGDRQRSLDDLGRALRLRRRLGDRRGTASTLTAIAWVHLRSGEPEAASGEFRQALALLEEAGDVRGQAITLYSLGVALQELGKTAEALACHRRALPIFLETGDRYQEAWARHNLGRALSASGRPQEAVDAHRQALAIFEDIGALSATITARQRLAFAERQRGALGTARRHLERAIRDVEAQRVKPASHHLRAAYFATRQSTYDLYVEVLMGLHRRDSEAGYDALALAASERARSRSQLDLLIESGADWLPGTDAAQRQESRELERKINAKELQRLWLLEGAGAAAQLGAVERALRELLRQHGQLQAQMRASHPAYSALAEPRLLDAEEIQRQVASEDTLFLEYDLGEERSYLWAVTPGVVASFELPGRAEIERAARRAYALLTVSHQRKGRVRTALVLAGLSDMLLRPAADLLPGKRLVIAGDGALHYVPWSALPIPEISPTAPSEALPLSSRHEVVSIPSASLLALLRRNLAARSPPPEAVAVLADPVFDAGDPRVESGHTAPGNAASDPAVPGSYPRLAHSQREARALLALAPPESSFAAFGFDASREMVLSGRLADYRLLHFATHGDLNSEHPELSRLVLSRFDATGRSREGFVYAHEIHNLDLPADLVVLSACQTALGKEIRGEGLVGLTRSFLYAGAAAVIVSLWRVDDRATAELMERFYDKLLRAGLRPAAALRSARESMRRERAWQAPYYWAGFVLQGEWR